MADIERVRLLLQLGFVSDEGYNDELKKSLGRLRKLANKTARSKIRRSEEPASTVF
jgi:hypothetical protein